MSEWIKCDERFPDIGAEVLAYARGFMEKDFKIIKASYYDKYEMKGRKPEYKFYECCDCSGYECDNMMIDIVTHWMPLPESPKE